MNKTLDDCDGAFWYLTTEQTNNSESIICNAEYYKLKGADALEQTDIGYKYNILLFRNNEVEYTKAWLGDPKGYIDRLSKIGYGGLLVKVDSVPVKTLKNMMKSVLSKVQMSNTEIKTILSQV